MRLLPDSKVHELLNKTVARFSHQPGVFLLD